MGATWENFEDKAYLDSNLEWRNRGISASDENSYTYYSAPTGKRTPISRTMCFIVTKSPMR